MFESAEQGNALPKSDYKRQVPELRHQLLQAQFALQSLPYPIIIIVEGVDNTVKGEVVNRLNEWLDTRGIEVYAFGAKTDEEAERPRFWRYWRSLPSRGRIALFSGSWYTGSLIHKTFNEIDDLEFDCHMKRIAAFEQTIADDGAVILKFWLHMSQQYQKKSFKALEKGKEYRWKVSELDYRLHQSHIAYTAAAKQAVILTNHPNTPWTIVEAEDQRYRDITVAKAILKAFQARIAGSAANIDRSSSPCGVAIYEGQPYRRDTDNILKTVDLTQQIEKSHYRNELATYQQKLNDLSWQAYHQKKSMVLVFEGWDAAGKGGVIRRIMQAVDARISRVISVAAPSDEELAHHYLWRFWRHVPRAGHVTLYDRSWYGRVLVERVEGFASPAEWQRAYHEINEFEDQLTDQNRVLCKFWLHIDKNEQLARFQLREQTPYKQHKITDEDWRNRAKWDEYEEAVNDMVSKTNTENAPWILVPATSKKFARIMILKTMCELLERTLDPT